jgi:hypothetical protein
MLQSRKVSKSGMYKSPEPRIPDLKQMIQYAVQSVLQTDVASSDMDLITRLCVMAAVPTGEENPHELLRRISDNVINAFATNLDTLQKNPMSAPVAQLFFMEWCFRRGYLNADWRWEWDTADEGHVSYSSKEPLEQLLKRAEMAC